MPYKFKNLIFEGGGVKGIAYVGALEVLKQKKVMQKIKRVGGTSAGAINALLVGLGYSVDEMKEILWNLDFTNFLDDSWGIIRDTERLIRDFGWYKGDFFRNWIGEIVEVKTGNHEATFAEVFSQNRFKELYFIGTNLSTHFSEVFSHEHTPRMCIADAVRISMSIPLFFTAKRSLRGDVYVDGGVLSNYPIKLFDRKKYVNKHARTTEYYDNQNAKLAKSGKRISKYVYNKETLGFRLDSEKEIALFRDHAEPERRRIGDFFSYAWALIQTVMEAQQSIHLHSDDWQRTVYIDTLGVQTTQFDLSNDMKWNLVESGREGANRYFEWYDNTATVNH
jgi:NTE family protein